MQEQSLITRREILAVLFRRKGEMLAIVVAAVSVAAFFAYYLVSPSYEAEAKIIINTSYLTEPLRDSPPESDFEKLAGFHTQRDIIESTRMAAEAVQRTRLAERRVIARLEKFRIQIGDMLRPVGELLGVESWKKPWNAEAAAIEYVDDWVKTAAVPDSKALKLSFRAKDPQEAVDVLNAILDAHVEYYYGVVRKKAQGVATFLQQEYDKAAADMRLAEQDLLKFRLKDNVLAANKASAGGAKEPSFVGITDSVKVQDEIKLYVLKLEEEARLAGEIPDNERRERVRGDIARRMKLYMDTINALPGRELELVRLKRKFESAHENFQLLQRNLTRANIVAIGETDKIRLVEIFERPRLNDSPVAPRKRLIMLLALGLGLVLAMTWAFTADFLDHTVRSRKDLERHLNLRLLASLRRLA
jgi:uncharacterized protein involved in exopolysaccharide biosynthesis